MIIIDSSAMVSTPLHMRAALTAERLLVKTGVVRRDATTKTTDPTEDPTEGFSDSDTDDELLVDDSDKSSYDTEDEDSDDSSEDHHHHHHRQQQSQVRRRHSVHANSPSKPSLSQQQQQHHNRSKSVGFKDIEIRSYPVVPGDHPCCTTGCPLSLGWEYSNEHVCSIDEYEASRSPRRSREDLKTSWDQRRSMLKEVGVSEGDLKRAERKLHRERSCQRKTQTKICATFFQNTPGATLTCTDAQQQPESRCI